MDNSLNKKKLEDLNEENKKIDFAKKSGEDLKKKDSGMILNKKGVEDIYDFKEKKASEEKKDTEIKDEEIPISEDGLILPSQKTEPLDLFLEKIKNLFSSKKKEENHVLEVNLVKEEIVKYFDWQKGLLVFLFAIFFSLSFLSLIYWGVSWWFDNRQITSSSLNAQEYFRIGKEIKELEPELNEVLAFKEKIDLSNSILDSHIYWTNFFDFLENNTLSNVYFSSFSGDISGNYQFSATSDSINAINAQIKKLLDNPYVKNARVDSTNIGTDNEGAPKISFNLFFLVDPKIFLKNSSSSN